MTPLVAGSHIIGDLTENREICIPACIQRLHWGGGSCQNFAKMFSTRMIGDMLS